MPFPFRSNIREEQVFPFQLTHYRSLSIHFRVVWHAISFTRCSESPGLGSRLPFRHGVTCAPSLWCVLYSLFPGPDVVLKVSVAAVDLVSWLSEYHTGDWRRQSSYVIKLPVSFVTADTIFAVSSEIINTLLSLIRHRLSALTAVASCSAW